MIYLLSTIIDFSFSVHKLAKFLSNPGKVHYEGLVHLLRYIGYNTNLGLHYYAGIKYVPLSDLLRQASIKTENQLMIFSDYIWQNCPDIGRIKGAYIICYQCGPIDHCTHVQVPVSQSSSESEYNAA